MRVFLKILAVAAGAIVAIVVIAFVSVSVIANGQIAEKYPMPAIAVPPIPTDSASIARGEHLARAVSNCVECHAEDLGGRLFMDAGPLGVAAGTNLTRGIGGIGATFTDADWVRAIKHGIRADSTSLMIMPSESFAHYSERDLGALIAYLKQLPPVDRQVEPTRLRILGKALMVTGALPVLVAGKTQGANGQAAEPAVSVEYGRYLADISGCHGCHGPALAGGGSFGPPDAPPPSNLTPVGPIASWSEADFLRAFREGKRPDGTAISEWMPWKVFGRMTDAELRAILLYLRSVPGARPQGATS